MATPIRFQGLVKTTAEIESDKFAGRIGWNTTLARFVAYYNATQYATMARRDVLETFSQGIQDSTQTAGRLTYATTGGRLAGDAGLLFSQTGGVTDSLIVGDGAVSPRIIINGANSQNSSLYLQGGGFNRWGFIRVANSNVLLIRAHDAAGGVIDSPISINNSAGGLITLGGAGRDVSLTGGLQIGGAQRISSAGRFDATSLYNSAWAGVGVRMLATDNVGMGYAMDAATARATIGALAAAEKGAANGVAPLGADSKIASAYLPSYVDDVLEYANLAAFPATGESGKIYVALDTNKTYRWSGSAYVVISETLALGETSSTAYRGDRGATAYTHSQATGNPHGTTYSQLASIPAALDAIDGLTPAADSVPYYTGANSAALAPLSAFGRSLIDDADAATARATIGAASASGAESLLYSDFGRTPSGPSSGTSAFVDNTASGLQLAANSIVSGMRIRIEQLVSLGDVSEYRQYQIMIGPLRSEGQMAADAAQYLGLLNESDTTQSGSGKIVTEIEFIGSGASVVAHVSSWFTLDGSGAFVSVRGTRGTIAVDNTLLRYIDIRMKPLDSSSTKTIRNRVFKLNP